MPELAQTISLQLGPWGQLIIPAAWLRALDIHDGETLLARLEGDRMVIEKRSAVRSRIRQRFETATPGASVVDELIAERRAEARRDQVP